MSRQDTCYLASGKLRQAGKRSTSQPLSPPATSHEVHVSASSAFAPGAELSQTSLSYATTLSVQRARVRQSDFLDPPCVLFAGTKVAKLLYLLYLTRTDANHEMHRSVSGCNTRMLGILRRGVSPLTASQPTSPRLSLSRDLTIRRKLTHPTPRPGSC